MSELEKYFGKPVSEITDEELKEFVGPPKGYCQCGCGQRTKISPKSSAAKGWIAGQPRMYVNGHNERGCRGEDHTRWSGGRKVVGRGYIQVFMLGHPRTNKGGYVMEHILVAEAVLGKYLPVGAEVHHKDGDRGNNQPSNLVICQDHAYHQLLHKRERAYKACGHANWLLCKYCKQYDDPKNMYTAISKGGKSLSGFHRDCKRALY